MPDRPWTERDQAIMDKKLYFVLTIWLPKKKRPIKHLWGPAPYHVARRRMKEQEAWWKRHGRPASEGTFIVDTIRWRAEI